MYTLTLTPAERQAIDWIGYRYAHGADFYHLLNQAVWMDGVEWADDADLTFRISEPLAWEMLHTIPEDNFACFSDEFIAKLLEFFDKIV